ncbi:hypothetical protein ACHAWX_000785 [Stephanocyclus meneghinianus]
MWTPKWTNVGVDLSCLDIIFDYLSNKVPNKNIELKKDKLLLIDGKDYTTATKRYDITIEKKHFYQRQQMAAFDLTWPTTKDGRGDWKDVAINDPWRPAVDDKFWTAMTDSMTATEYNKICNRFAQDRSLVSNEILDDGILITGQPTGLVREGLNGTPDDTDSNGDEVQRADDKSKSA